MHVKKAMTTDVAACSPETNLASVVQVMWDRDCGLVPVIDEAGRVLGVVTDRDICMATAMKDCNPSGISVEEVMTGTVYAAAPQEDIEQALKTMREHRIRRLPVLDLAGELEGILSLNDIVLKAKGPNGKKTPQIDYADFVKTYQAICEHALPMATAATVAK